MSDDNLQEPKNEGELENSTSEENAEHPQTSTSNAEKTLEEHSPNDFEINHEVNELFEWIENKLKLLKVLNCDESDTSTMDKIEIDATKEDRNASLEEIMEDIQKITSKEIAEPTKSISGEVTRMLDMLQETTMGLLDNLNPSEKRCRNIKVLATLIQHLSASVGTKVTIEEVQKYINGQRVIELFEEVQNGREPVLVKMVTAKKYIGYGIRRTRNIGKKCKRHGYVVDDLLSGSTASANLQIQNEKLKEVAKESENLLIKFSDSIGYLATKTKNFFSLKQDSERLLSSFMLKEIPDLYKTSV